MPVTKKIKAVKRPLTKKQVGKKPKANTAKASVKRAAQKNLPLKSKATKVAASTRKIKLPKVAPIPAGYAAITPYLIVKNAAQALQFYKKAFAAKEIMRFTDPKGKIMHAEMKLGDSMMMLAEECSEKGAAHPHSIGGTSVMFHLYVKNVDATTKKAIAAGAKEKRAVQNQFYGDRSGCVIDPFGHIWNISTHVEDVSPREIKKRVAALQAKA